MMRFLIFWNKCKNCDHAFNTLSDPGRYDLRLLLSEKTHQPAIVKVDADPAFSECYRIVQEYFKPKGYTALKTAKSFNAVFGKICERAPDGSIYNMTGKPRCQNCGSYDMSFGPYEPAVYEDHDPPEVSHKIWDNMHREEKEKLIKDLLGDL